jgi:hypothetical protein
MEIPFWFWLSDSQKQRGFSQSLGIAPRCQSKTRLIDADLLSEFGVKHVAIEGRLPD